MGDQTKINSPYGPPGYLAVGSGFRVPGSGLDGKNLTTEKAAKDFESFLIFTMLKEMEKNTHQNKKGYMEQTYMSVVYEKVADHLAKKGLGIKDMLMKYLERADAKVLRPKGDNSDE
jgi:Rod binding domain-containing protein